MTTVRQQTHLSPGFLNVYSSNEMLNIIKKITFNLFVALLFTTNNTYANTKNWNFKVSLNGDEIGYHKFTIVEQKEGKKEIYSTANFNVKFLFFTAYTYRHDNIETWSNNCLQTIKAITDDNGDLLNVNGYKTDTSTNINTQDKNVAYPKCIQTFAYWDMSFLKEKKLLNSQTGELMEIESQYIGKEEIKSNDKLIQANRYRITGTDLQIDLWYSDSKQWLALESITTDGHTIKYEIN